MKTKNSQTKTPARQLLELVWASTKQDSWERINHSMRNALSLAIGSGMTFAASDFRNMAEFRWHYWVGSSDEWIYSMAIVVGNTSCVEAYEQWKGRQPFRANNVHDPRWQSAGGYIHAHSVYRQRERLAVGFGVKIDERQWWVTTFNDAKGTIRLATYAEHWQEGKPAKLKTLTHDECAALFPAPKKQKAKQAAGVIEEI